MAVGDVSLYNMYLSFKAVDHFDKVDIKRLSLRRVGVEPYYRAVVAAPCGRDLPHSPLDIL